MKIKIYPTSELRSNISGVIKDVVKEADTCYITNHGKAEAVLMGIERYNYLMSLAEDALDEQDKSIAKRVKEARNDYAKGKSIPFKPSKKSAK